MIFFANASMTHLQEGQTYRTNPEGVTCQTKQMDH